jgi:hypothetical protein
MITQIFTVENPFWRNSFRRANPDGCFFAPYLLCSKNTVNTFLLTEAGGCPQVSGLRPTLRTLFRKLCNSVLMLRTTSRRLRGLVLMLRTASRRLRGLVLMLRTSSRRFRGLVLMLRTSSRRLRGLVLMLRTPSRKIFIDNLYCFIF